MEQQQLSQMELDSADTFATFTAALRGRDRAFFTPTVCEQNMTVMVSWCLGHGMTLADSKKLGFWELSFAAVKSSLTIDPTAPVLAQIRKEEQTALRKRIDSMSSAEYKHALLYEPGFEQAVNALETDPNLSLKGI